MLHPIPRERTNVKLNNPPRLEIYGTFYAPSSFIIRAIANGEDCNAKSQLGRIFRSKIHIVDAGMKCIIWIFERE